MATFGKSFLSSKINWMGIIAMGWAFYEFWNTFKTVDKWDANAIGQFAFGALIVVFRTWYTSQPINTPTLKKKDAIE